MDEKKGKWSVRITVLGKPAARPMVIDNIVADGIVESVKYRWFALEDRTLIEIPMGRRMFQFSKERAEAIEAMQKAQQTQQAKTGQPPTPLFNGPRPV